MQEKHTNQQHRRGSPVFASLLSFLFSGCLFSTSAWTQPLPQRVPAPAVSAPAPLHPASAASIIDLRIHDEQARIARDPDYWASYNRLASAYAQKARETGEISYFELAESALQKSLQLESTHEEAAPAWTQLASVHLAEHRFHEAADDANKAIALTPNDFTAYPYAGDAQLEMGNYEAARTFYRHLSAAPSDERPHPGLDFLHASHGAGLHWIEGSVQEASEDLKRAISLARELHLPRENIAWTEFMLGEQFFQAGDLSSAEAAETSSLGDFPSYHRAFAAMGQIRAAQQRYPEAITFYKKAIAIIPLPVYIAALGDLYSVSGDAPEAGKQYALVEFIGKLSAINQQVFNRELATFYADHDVHLDEALTLARKELEVRRDVYTFDALAWTLLKNGRREDAQLAIEDALRMGTRDAMMEYHAGMIYTALDDKIKAAAHLKRALEICPRFHVIFAAQAATTLELFAKSGQPGSQTAIGATPKP